MQKQFFSKTNGEMVSEMFRNVIPQIRPDMTECPIEDVRLFFLKQNVHL